MLVAASRKSSGLRIIDLNRAKLQHLALARPGSGQGPAVEGGFHARQHRVPFQVQARAQPVAVEGGQAQQGFQIRGQGQDRHGLALFVLAAAVAHQAGGAQRLQDQEGSGCLVRSSFVQHLVPGSLAPFGTQEEQHLDMLQVAVHETGQVLEEHGISGGYQLG
jgi:hypothetical protein